MQHSIVRIFYIQELYPLDIFNHVIKEENLLYADQHVCAINQIDCKCCMRIVKEGKPMEPLFKSPWGGKNPPKTHLSSVVLLASLRKKKSKSLKHDFCLLF